MQKCFQPEHNIAFNINELEMLNIFCSLRKFLDTIIYHTIPGGKTEYALKIRVETLQILKVCPRRYRGAIALHTPLKYEISSLKHNSKNKLQFFNFVVKVRQSN